MAANMDIVRAEWRARAVAEYRSASIAAEYLSWLLRLGFSSDTLQAAFAVLGNELDHADMTWEVFDSLGDAKDPLGDLPEGTLVLSQGFGEPTFERVVLVTLDVYCIGETLAAALYRAMQQGASENAPVQLLERLVADAEQHVEFGWNVLDECLERSRKKVSATAKKNLPAYFARAERAWGLLPDTWIEPVGPHELRFGLIPRARYKREFYQAIAEQVLPLLDERNLNGRAAWGRRPRSGGKKAK